MLGLDEVFEAMFLSGELGIEKPDRRIYAIACDEMGVEPQYALFVDDLPENVKGARAFGVAAHQHRSNAETIDWIRSHLG